MNLAEQTALLLRRLELDEEPPGLTELFGGFLALAMDTCNRQSGQETDTLLALAREAAAAAWRRRGDEGSVSASVGGQSYGYVDIEAKLCADLRRANQRLARL